MTSKKLDSYLSDHGIQSLRLEHEPAFSAQEVAHSVHVSGKILTKTVIINVDGRMAIAMIHARDRLDLDLLRDNLGAREVTLVSEDEIRKVFADCEPGATLPFGNLYGMEVFVAPDVPTEGDIVFSAGTHTEVMAIPFRDFAAHVQPVVVPMTVTIH